MKVVKVFVKQEASMDLSAFESEVIRVRNELRENTNAQAVQQTLENEKVGNQFSKLPPACPQYVVPTK